jgi:phosphoribosylglycinamide formyltransferase 1
MLTPLYDSKKGKMRVVGLVSGSGVSLRGMLEQQKEMEAKGWGGYEVVGIFTESLASKAYELGLEFNIPVVANDIRRFYKERNAKITDLKIREEFDRETVRMLEPLRPDLIAYAGYVWITTAPLVDAFMGINFHPADLSIEEGGKRKYTGANGVRDALAAGETWVAATLHIVTAVVDSGPILLVSKPVNVERPPAMTLDELSVYYLRILNKGKSPLFARATKDIAEGTFKRDEKGLMYYGETPIPRGYRL